MLKTMIEIWVGEKKKQLRKKEREWHGGAWK